jgi:hypothetical protein
VKRGVLVALSCVVAVAHAAPPRIDPALHVWGDGTLARAPRSWLAGGFGRFDAGESSDGSGGLAGRVAVEGGLDFFPVESLRLYIHAVAREESPRAGDRVGVVEAYAESRAQTRAGLLQTRAGQFFLPTSRENVEELWSSPYLSTFSGINSWMAHEVRPIGLDGEWRMPAGDALEVRVGGTIFGGNDSMGALLAWRGWSLSRRVSVTGEVLPLPPLESLRDAQMFGRQRSDGTRPIGGDLDGRPGYSARLRLQAPAKGSIQLLHLDTRGDRMLHQGEYAWATRFDHLAADWTFARGTTIAGEWIRGDSGMGDRAAAFVQIDFDSRYLLLSYAVGRCRYTIRGEEFDIRDRDHSVAEDDDDHGTAVTAGMKVQWHRSVSATLEFVHLQGDHAAAPENQRDRAHRAGSVSLDLTF